MGNKIHPTAIIDPSAVLADGVDVGPYSIIEADVEIGENTKIASHVVIEARTILGKNGSVSPGAVLGGAPQDFAYKNELSRVRIGDNARIRESATVNRATGEGAETIIGDNVYMMAYSHVAHNCVLDDNVIMANLVQLAGHVTVGEHVVIGGDVVVHQFSRIGKLAMIGGASCLRQDACPFSITEGTPGSIQGLNTIGMRRQGFTAEQRARLKKAFFYLWYSDLNHTQAIEMIRENIPSDPNIDYLIEFVSTTKRGISHNKRGLKHYKSKDHGESEPAKESV